MSINEETLEKECLEFLKNDEELNRNIHKVKSSVINHTKKRFGKNKKFSIQDILFTLMSLCVPLIFISLFIDVFITWCLMGLCFFFSIMNLKFIFDATKVYSNNQQSIKNKILAFMINDKNNYLEQPDMIKALYNYENNIRNSEEINIFKNIETAFLKSLDKTHNQKIEDKKISTEDSIDFKLNTLKTKYLIEKK